ncbi:hypothetical protein QJQ45_006537 [Haematococcus lacustris]|nr:hypothetical protein QJQ45_006537 [Haematococcus lacustris]
MHVRQDIVSVGVNRVVNAVDWSNSGLVAYGAHTMVALYEPQLLVSGSEDATLRVWQVHASELVQAAQPSTHPQQQPWSQVAVIQRLSAGAHIQHALALTHLPGQPDWCAAAEAAAAATAAAGDAAAGDAAGDAAVVQQSVVTGYGRIWAIQQAGPGAVLAAAGPGGADPLADLMRYAPRPQLQAAGCWEESPSKSAWHVTCKRCPWTASINSVTRVAQHISGSKTDVKKCTAPDPEMVQLVRQHDASAASAASSTHKRRGEDGMEPSPSRQRASRNASQDVVTKEMIDDTVALQRLDSQLAPMRAERSHFGCSVSFDGYTDESARSMLNATVTTPSGSMLESAIDTGNNKKTSVYLKETLKAVIMRVGVEDVVAVFSDNAANCVAAGKMLEEDEDLRVLSIPCGSHTLDLLLEDIGKPGLVHFVRARPAVTWLFRTISMEMAARVQLPSHAQPLNVGGGSTQAGGAMAGRGQLATGLGQLPSGGASRQQAGAQPGAAARRAAIAEAVAQAAAPKAVAPSDTVTAYKALQLLNPGETRFCSVLTMCQRVLDTYPALQAMVCDPRWARWQAAADRPTREAAEKIKNLVLGTAGKHSATWLLHVRQLVSIMEPIRVVLRMMDSSQPVISKVWFALKRMEQAIRAAIVEHNIPNAEQILLATERRTSMLLRPLHGAAALLDPEYRQHFNMRGESSAGQLDFQAVLPDLMKVAEKLSPTSAAECVVQLPKYLHATTAMAAATAKSMPPHEWHRIHTGGALGALAMKVTSQVASATSCERAWSSYGFVHNPRRNRLTASNAEMLTQLYFNSRLLKRAGKGCSEQGVGVAVYDVTLESLLVGHEDWVHSVRWQPRVQIPAGGPPGGLGAEGPEGAPGLGGLPPKNSLCLLTASMDRTMALWVPERGSGLWMNVASVGDAGAACLGYFGGVWGPQGKHLLAHGFTDDCIPDSATDMEAAGKLPQNGVAGPASKTNQPGVLATDAAAVEHWCEIGRPQVHGHDFSCLAFLPHGTLAASYAYACGSEEKVVRVMEAPRVFLDTLDSLQPLAGPLDPAATPATREAAGGAGGSPQGPGSGPWAGQAGVPGRRARGYGASVSALGLTNKAMEQGGGAGGTTRWGPAVDCSCLVGARGGVGAGGYEDGPDFAPHAAPCAVSTPPLEEHLAQVGAGRAGLGPVNTLWPEGHKLYGHGDLVYCAAASPDGALLASACVAKASPRAAAVWVWDVAGDTWRGVAQLESASGPAPHSFRLVHRQKAAHARIIWGCAWSNDDRLLATGARDGLIKIWDTAPLAAAADDSSLCADWTTPCEPPPKLPNAPLLTLPPFPSAVTALAFMPGAAASPHVLAVGLEDGALQLWSIPSQSSVEGPARCLWRSDPLNGHAAQVSSVAWRDCGDCCQLATAMDLAVAAGFAGDVGHTDLMAAAMLGRAEHHAPQQADADSFMFDYADGPIDLPSVDDLEVAAAAAAAALEVLAPAPASPSSCSSSSDDDDDDEEEGDSSDEGPWLLDALLQVSTSSEDSLDAAALPSAPQQLVQLPDPSSAKLLTLSLTPVSDRDGERLTAVLHVVEDPAATSHGAAASPRPTSCQAASTRAAATTSAQTAVLGSSSRSSAPGGVPATTVILAAARGRARKAKVQVLAPHPPPSSSSSSSSSSEEGSGDEGVVLMDRDEMHDMIARAYAAADEEDEDEGKGGAGGGRSRQGQQRPGSLALEVEVAEGDALDPAGCVLSVLEGVVVVQGLVNSRALAEGSVLVLDETRQAIGRIEEVFGPVTQPFYALRWSSPGPPPPALKPGARLASLARCAERIAPEMFVGHERPVDYDPGVEVEEEEEVYFSDDEAEAAYTRKLQMKRKAEGEAGVATTGQAAPGGPTLKALGTQPPLTTQAMDSSSSSSSSSRTHSRGLPPPTPINTTQGQGRMDSQGQGRMQVIGSDA